MLRHFESERFYIGKRSRIAEKNATVSIPVLRGIFFGLANTGCKSSAAED